MRNFRTSFSDWPYFSTQKKLKAKNFGVSFSCHTQPSFPSKISFTIRNSISKEALCISLSTRNQTSLLLTKRKNSQFFQKANIGDVPSGLFTVNSADDMEWEWLICDSRSRYWQSICGWKMQQFLLKAMLFPFFVNVVM